MRRIAILIASLFIISSGLSASAHEGHDHSAREWDGKSAPRLAVVVTKDMMSGYNINIRAKGFKWAPQRASMAHRAGEGHAHLYLNGVKVGRIYGSWYHLPTSQLNLKPGTHEIKVELSSNDHSPYTHKGKSIARTVKFKV